MTTFTIAPYELRSDELQPWLAERVRDRPAKYARAGRSALSEIGPDVVSQLIARGAATGQTLAPLAPLVANALAQMVERSRSAALSFVELDLIDLYGALATSGVSVGDADFKAILSAIRTSRKDDQPQYHWHRGFLALALAVPEVYRGIAGFELREPIPFTPRATFGPNLQGCLAHFAGAVESGASLESCLPAWADLAAYSMPLLQAGSFTPSIFLWGAWLLHHRIARQPLGTVADWMHESLYRLAGATP